MDVKNTFLNGFINEEVFVEQLSDFQSFNSPNHVFKLKKTFYGLKQAPSSNMLLVRIYVDDIIFGAINVSLCEEFSKCMHSEFEMSIMGELNFFLGLQIKQLKE